MIEALPRSRCGRLALVVAGFVLSWAAACAQEAHHRDARECGGRGPHDATASHPFDNVERWVAIFDDQARDAWQKPDEIVRELQLKPAQRVVDLGAGTGYFVGRLSKAVGVEGIVWALDTEPKMVEHVKERAASEGWTNARAQVCPADSPGLPEGVADLVLIVDTYHHIDDRLNYLPRLERILAPGGRVAIVDFRKDVPPPPGPPPEHRLAREAVVSEFEQAGWSLVKEPEILKHQYFLVFAPRRGARK